MKETVFDVLMYLFENYFDTELDFDSDQDVLRDELVSAGFPDISVDKAFDWLEGLSEDEGGMRGRQGDCRTTSTRIYTRDEMEKLDVECRGFILFLEQVGVLDGMMRELVIDRVMALDSDEIDLEQLKWVCLMVLFNRPDRDPQHNWMEELVIDYTREGLN